MTQPPTDRARPGLAPPRKYAADALRAAARKAPAELDSGQLTLPDGDGIEIVTVAQVIEWLDGLAVRAENGGLL